MTKIAIIITSIIVLFNGGCAGSSGSNAFTDVKQQLNKDIYRQCISNPEKLGYPTSTSGYQTLMSMGVRLNVNPAEFCRRSAYYVANKAFSNPNIAGIDNVDPTETSDKI